MNFNGNNIPSQRVHNASKLSSPRLGPAVSMEDKENDLLNNPGIYQPPSPATALSMAKVSPILKMDMSSKKKKSSRFGDRNSVMLPPTVIGKRGPPPEDMTIRASAQKKRCVDGGHGGQATGKVASKSVPPMKHGLNIPDLLPIQYDSWLDLPERWDYYSPDGRRIKQRRWSPSHDGDNTATNYSDRLHHNGDRGKATAATVAAWVNVNRLRLRYQELVAEFHAGPLVVHHLADKELEQQWANIKKASLDLEKALEAVGRGSRPRPQFSWAMAPIPITNPRVTMAAKAKAPIGVSPPDTLLPIIQAEDAGLGQVPAAVDPPTDTSAPPTPAGPTESLEGDMVVAAVDDPLEVPAATPPIVALAATPPVIPTTSSTPQPPQQATPNPEPNPSSSMEQEVPVAGPPIVPPSTGASNTTTNVTGAPQATTLSTSSTASTAYHIVSPNGQFRFTAAGEARFKLLCEQMRYDEMYEMLPVDQHVDHLNQPDAIAAFRAVHPRPNKGGQKAETKLWVCKAKVKMVVKELPRANAGEPPRYSYTIVYLEEPCNGVTGTPCNTRRHKQRSHLGRPYD